MTPCCLVAFLGVAMPPLPHAPSLRPLASQGKGGSSPGATAPGGSWLEAAAGSSPSGCPSHTGQAAPGDAPAEPLAGRRAWGRAPAAGTCRRVSPSPCTASQPCPGLPGGEHVPTVHQRQGPALPGRGPLARGGTGCLPAAPRHGLRRSWHRPAGAARVGLTPRFESVQEAAYQRSCCLCRFLSLLLPHPACRPHTYRPHRRSSAPPGRLQPQPRSPLANTRPVPLGAALPPPKSWGASMGTSSGASGVCSVPSATGHGQRRPTGHGGTGKTRLWDWARCQKGHGGLPVVQWCCPGDTRPHLPQGEPG